MSIDQLPLTDPGPLRTGLLPEEDDRGAHRQPAVLAAVGIGALACLFRLGQASLWLDETWSAMLTHTTLGEFTEQVRSEGGSQVLYYVLLRGWSTFGHDEAWLRLLSVVFAVATLVVFHRLAVRLFDRRVALLAVCILGINPFFVRYAQEARAYSLAMLLVTAATLALVSGVETGARRSWLLYGLLAGLSLYAHLFSVFVLAAHGLSLLALPRRQIPWRGLTTAAVAGTVMVIPLAVLIWGANAQIDDVGGRSLATVKTVVASLAGARGWPANLVVGAAWVAGALVAVEAARRRGRHLRTWRSALVLSWAAAPLAIASVLSIVSPILHDRYQITAMPGLSLLAAVGFGRIRSTRILAAAMAFVLALSLLRIHDQAGAIRHEEDWRAVASSVLADADQGDRLVFQLPWMSVPFQYYALLQDVDHPDIRFHVPGEGYLPFSEIPEGSDVEGVASRDRLFAERVARGLFGWVRAYRPDDLPGLVDPTGDTVWLISRGEHPDVSVEDLAQALQPSHDLVEERVFGVIKVLRYEPVVR